MTVEKIAISTEDWDRANEIRAEEDAVRDVMRHSIDTFTDLLARLNHFVKTEKEESYEGEFALKERAYKDLYTDMLISCETRFCKVEMQRIDLWRHLRDKYGLDDNLPYSINYHAPELWLRVSAEADLDNVEDGIET